MIDQVKNLYSRAKGLDLGKLYGKWKVKKQGISTTVEIYEKGLIEKDVEQAIEFDFDLKFGFTNDPIEIKFQRGKDSSVYTLAHQSDLQNWRQILKSKINQRGFHQQFKPLKKIGKGNFASVFLAHKLQDGIHYAVKAFSKEAAYSQQNGKECLVKQIDIARELNHSNCMKLYQVFESQNSLYIIFELLSGGQLYDKVKTKYQFKPHEVRGTLYGILKGLNEMHSKGIMHRDLKPQNLLFRKEGDWDCVIADYGLAEFSKIQSYLFVRCGTPGYVAPEVINIKDMKTKYSPICDIFSLGLIFYILLYGKSAFPGTTYNDVLNQNRAANIDLSGQSLKKVGFEAHDLLQKMLKKDPQQRINAADALKHPYFENVASQKVIQASPKKGLTINTKPTGQKDDYPVLDSPLLTTANQKRKLDKNLKKDSCVDFHMGKQNVFTGKTQEVDSMKSNKVSIINANTPARKPKVSQFCAQHK